MQTPIISKGFDYFWHYAFKRQQVYLKKQAGQPFPYTDDVVLRKYRFTNVYRYTDKVSQYLINHIQKDNQYDWQDIFIRTMLFKFFNSITTWQAIEDKFSVIDRHLLMSRNLDLFLINLSLKQALYNPAYVLPPPQKFSGKKCIRHLNLIRSMVNDKLFIQLKNVYSLKEAFQLLKNYDSVGNFLAYQFVIDLNYSTFLNYEDGDSFVVAGVGAKRGIKKCFTDYTNEEEVIIWTHSRYKKEFSKRNLPFLDLNNQPLELIDIQNIFCELDKYLRIVRPDFKSSNQRIKQLYRPTGKILTSTNPRNNY